MNYTKACSILNVPKNSSAAMIKRMYYKKALQLHPDKHGDTEQFQELNEAYQFLQFNSEPDFIGMIYDKSILSILSTLDNSVLLSLYRFLLEYKDYLPPSVLDTITQFIQNKLTILLLEPTIDDLLNQRVYIYTHLGKKYSIPLWHHELIYDEFMVICKPKIENIELDSDNNIYITVHSSIQEAFTGTIPFFIGKQSFTIDATQLYIKPYQEYSMTSTIPIINPHIYTNTCSMIYVSIHLI
jgi:hypothetical protein